MVWRNELDHKWRKAFSPLGASLVTPALRSEEIIFRMCDSRAWVVSVERTAL